MVTELALGLWPEAFPILTFCPVVWIQARAQGGDTGAAGPVRFNDRQKLRQNLAVQLVLVQLARQVSMALALCGEAKVLILLQICMAAGRLLTCCLSTSLLTTPLFKGG